MSFSTIRFTILSFIEYLPDTVSFHSYSKSSLSSATLYIVKDFKSKDIAKKDEREYPLVITAEEKDKVLNYILVVANGKRTAKLNYKDIPDLRISKEQYEIVLEEFKKRRFIDYKGYGIEYLTLNFEIFNFAEKGGFTVERDLYILSFDTFQMQLERLEKELSPDTAAKVDDVVGKAKNITELLIGLSALAEKMNL